MRPKIKRIPGYRKTIKNYYKIKRLARRALFKYWLEHPDEYPKTKNFRESLINNYTNEVIIRHAHRTIVMYKGGKQ